MVLAVLRNVRGKSVDDIIEHHNHKYLRSVEKKVVNSDEDYSLDRIAKTTAAGEFYECLAHAYEGGVRKDIHSVLRGYVPPSNYKPDLVDEETILEQKASKEKTRLNLHDFQMRSMHAVQFLSPQRRYGLQLFRHNADTNLIFKKRSIKELFEALSENTNAMIEIPLSIATRLWLDAIRKEKSHNLVWRYDGVGSHQTTRNGYKPRERVTKSEERMEGGWLSCSCISESAINAFLNQPERTIETLGMDPDLFIYERFTYPSVKNNGFRVPKVPVLRITDRYNALWLEYFVQTLNPANLLRKNDYDIAIEKIKQIIAQVDALPTGVNSKGYDMRR